MKLGYIIIRPKQKYSLNSKGATGFKKSKNCFFGWENECDCHGVILIDYLQKGKTTTGACYVSHLSCCHGENSRITVWTAWPSAVLTRSSPKWLFLFPHLKIAPGGPRFSSNEEAIAFVNNYFVEKNAGYYLDGLQRSEHRWEKCVYKCVTRRLCWKIFKKSKKCLVSLLDQKLFRTLSYNRVPTK